MADTFWKDAAKGGLIIGAIVTAALYIKAWLASPDSLLGFLISVVELTAVAYFIYTLSKYRSVLADLRTGYSYGKNMGFVMAVMLLAGFIYGVGYYLLINYISPDFGEAMIEESVKMSYAMYGDMADSVVGMAYKLFASPFFWMFYGIFAMIIYGGIVGLVISAFVTRKPDIFADNNSNNG